MEQMAKDSGMTKTAAGKVLDALTRTIISTLKKDDKVTLVGFGTFQVSKRAARNARNPQTGEIIKLKATKVPRFKAGKVLLDTIASGKPGKKSSAQ